METLKKFPTSDQSSPKEKFKEPIIPPSVDKPIDPYEWFIELVGCTEKELRSNPENVFFNTDEGLCIRNRTNGVITKCGKLTLTKFGNLFNQDIIKYPFFLFNYSYAPIRILARISDRPEAIKKVDVSYLQTLPENRFATFQIASNFNGIESPSYCASVNDVSFTENYIGDRTQGPIASISAGGGAITRVHTAYYDPLTPPSNWRQTTTQQYNFLSELQQHFPVRNGYVKLKKISPKFPKTNTPDYKRLLFDTYVCYHRDIQVTSGPRGVDGYERINNPSQVIDQVFVSAINLKQEILGTNNSCSPQVTEKCKFILDYAYQCTYLAASVHKRTHLFLTLVGGGVFGNNKEWIYEALINAHKKWSIMGYSSIQQVTLVIYSPKDRDLAFEELLHHHKINYVVEMF
jgi:hypothetical protein